MTLPGSIKIGAKTYGVVKRDLSRDNETGHCDNEFQYIAIDEKFADDEQRETLIHELLHACCHFAGMQDDEQLTQEQFISRLSPILYTVLQENPSLLQP